PTHRLVGRFPFHYRRGLLSGRQKNSKARSLPWFAIHFHPALVLVNNSINRRQSETGPFADFFRRKERLENPPQILRLNAASIVCDAQANKIAWSRFTLIRVMICTDCRVGNFNPQLPAF